MVSALSVPDWRSQIEKGALVHSDIYVSVLFRIEITGLFFENVEPIVRVKAVLDDPRPVH